MLRVVVGFVVVGGLAAMVLFPPIHGLAVAVVPVILGGYVANRLGYRPRTADTATAPVNVGGMVAAIAWVVTGLLVVLALAGFASGTCGGTIPIGCAVGGLAIVVAVVTGLMAVVATGARVQSAPAGDWSCAHCGTANRSEIYRCVNRDCGRPKPA